MLNDFLSGEEAKERIKRSIQDAETNSLLTQLGYRNTTIRWLFVLMLIAVVAVGLML